MFVLNKLNYVFISISSFSSSGDPFFVFWIVVGIFFFFFELKVLMLEMILLIFLWEFNIFLGFPLSNLRFLFLGKGFCFENPLLFFFWCCLVRYLTWLTFSSIVMGFQYCLSNAAVTVVSEVLFAKFSSRISLAFYFNIEEFSVFYCSLVWLSVWLNVSFISEFFGFYFT